LGVPVIGLGHARPPQAEGAGPELDGPAAPEVPNGGSVQHPQQLEVRQLARPEPRTGPIVRHPHRPCLHHRQGPDRCDLFTLCPLQPHKGISNAVSQTWASSWGPTTMECASPDETNPTEADMTTATTTAIDDPPPDRAMGHAFDTADAGFVEHYRQYGFAIIDRALDPDELTGITTEAVRLCAGDLGEIGRGEPRRPGESDQDLLRRHLCIHN